MILHDCNLPLVEVLAVMFENVAYCHAY